MRKLRTWFTSALIFVFLIFLAFANVSPRRARAQGDSSLFLDSSSLPTEAEKHGFDLSNLDTSVSACANFFQYADGGWVKNNPIPAAYATWGSFSVLAENNREHVRDILEDAAKKKAPQAPQGSNDQKIGDYYASCMDEAGIEAAGLKPIEPELNRIAAIKDHDTLEQEVARLQKRGITAPFRFRSGQDQKDSTQVIGQLSQGGLTLPDRDYYTKDDDDSKRIRDKFLAHVQKMFQLMGDDDAAAAGEARTVMSLETKLAEASMTRIQQRDPDATYHKMSVAELEKTAPGFDWNSYFKNVGASNVASLNVGMPDFLKAAADDLKTIPLADWKPYLRWHLLNSSATQLPKKFVDEDFEFRGRVLTGTTEILPRWKRCVQATDMALGEAVGQEYVKRYFPPEAKQHAMQMVQNLISALQDDLKTLPWMSDETRQRALAKLNAFMRKIGYPDKWRDYSALKVTRASYAENAMNGRVFEFNRSVSKIGKPVDRTEWAMTPPTVNAYYNPSLNEIVFPAGILQPPFYDPNVDDAINYGGIGAVIGHEMTHGFDDSGAKFDAEGNRTNWWTDEDLKKFNERTKCVADQFDSYEVLPGVHEKGKLVLGESIADLGGLAIAYAAFEKSLAGKPRPPLIDGFTPEQRFFLGWAQVWAENERPEYERLQVNTNPHPVGRFRVIGPLSNMPAFAQAFQCKAGDAMVRPPEKRCQIW
jgi:putative endopeptidase